jgi:hypothetical protein
MTPHPTATPLAALNNGDVFSPFTIGLGITAALLVAGIGLMKLKRRKP